MSWFDQSPEDITEGPLTRALLVLSAPLLVQNTVRIAEKIVDIFWVGHYSSDAVAAIGLAAPILGFLLSAVISAPFVGTQVLVSQRVGADDATGARRMAFTGLTLAVVLGIAIGGIIFLGTEPLLDLIVAIQPTGASGNVPRLATIYLEVLAVGIVFAAVSDVLEAAFLGWGDSRAPLYMNTTTVVFNLTLDPVLIFGFGPIPELGMYGAALATVGSWIGGMVLGVVLFARGRAGWVITRDAIAFDADEFRELLDVGLPAAVKGAAGRTAGMVVSIAVFMTGGAAGLAAFTVGQRVSSVAFRATNALKQAAQSIVGQNLGAGRPERALRTTRIGVTLTMSILTVLGVVMWVVPASLTRLLVPEISLEGLALSVTYLQILALALPARGALTMIKAGLNGAKHTKTTMVASVAETWGVRLPIAIVGGLLLNGGIIAIFWSATIGSIVGAVALGGYYVVATRNGLFDRAADRVDASGISSD